MSQKAAVYVKSTLTCWEMNWKIQGTSILSFKNDLFQHPGIIKCLSKLRLWDWIQSIVNTLLKMVLNWHNTLGKIIENGLAFVELPAILGVDVAGIVEDTGPNVANYKKGDRVSHAQILVLLIGQFRLRQPQDSWGRRIPTIRPYWRGPISVG